MSLCRSDYVDNEGFSPRNAHATHSKDADVQQSHDPHDATLSPQP